VDKTMIDNNWKKAKEFDQKLKLAYEAALKEPRTYLDTRKGPRDKQIITQGFATPIQISFFYKGEVRGGFPDGLGEMTYQFVYGTLLKDNTVFYQGEFLGGDPNGKGMLTIREKDGDVTYETSKFKKADGTIIEGKFKGLTLKADGFFKYSIKKNNKIFNDGNVFLFKDQNNNESVFNELSIETFIKGEAFSSKEPHTLTYDENSTFYWLSGNYKIIYKGVVTKLNNTDEANKIKKELCLASKFPIPNGKGSMTSINLDKKSEWYNKKQTMSGTFKMWTEHGVMKKYIDDDLISEGNYTNGKKDGLFKIFNEDGTIEDEILFKDGIEQINKK